MAKTERKPNELGWDYGRQIVADLRTKTAISAFNHLIPANVGDYCQIHGKYSRVQIFAQDYSKGTGDKSVFLKYNLSPEDVKAIFHIVEMIYPLYPGMDYKQKFEKTPDGNVAVGNDFTALVIERVAKLNNQWAITLVKGKFIELQNKKVAADYKNATKISQRYTDLQFYEFWCKVNAFVCNWEMSKQAYLAKQGEPLTRKALKEDYDKRELEKRANVNVQNNLNVGNNHQKSNNSRPKNGNSRKGGYNQQRPQQSVSDNIPPLAPPPAIPEDDIPFEKMPSYGTGYRR